MLDQFILTIQEPGISNDGTVLIFTPNAYQKKLIVDNTVIIHSVHSNVTEELIRKPRKYRIKLEIEELTE